MKLSQNAQHSLEYVILMTIIMAGIIIGAPYVTRSWNAQMKGWEDSVIDSMNDPLTEAPPDIVSIPGCDFVSWGSCDFTDCCGLGYPLFGKSISCTARQLLQLGKFKPLGCELSDPSMSFDLIARCNTNNANHCCTPWVTPSGCAPGSFGCPQDSDCGVNVGCPDGQYRRNRVCDTGYPETGCVADPGCNFTCGGPLTGFVPIANATFCSGDDTGLSGDANYVISSSCTPAKCEYVCNPPFVSNGTQCVCPPGCSPSGGTCVGQSCASIGLCPGSTPRSDGCVGTIFCSYCAPWCCGAGCPADAFGTASPIWDGKQLSRVAAEDFIWSGAPTASGVNTGDAIASYFILSGDRYTCGFNKTTGRWAAISKCVNFFGHCAAVNGVDCGGGDGCAGAPFCQNLNGGWGCF